VLNDTRVLPARIIGRKPTGGRVELLLERATAPRQAFMQARASHALKAGGTIELPATRARVEGRRGQLFDLAFDCDVAALLETHGEVPLPPYIEREADSDDRERYQTVFARSAGAVAAPTAGLHFDREMLLGLDALGVAHAFLTLHVGAGTFAPVRTERIEDHELHAERLRVPLGSASWSAAARAAAAWSRSGRRACARSRRRPTTARSRRSTARAVYSSTRDFASEWWTRS
jgi:S-adenosylmethionine:tRNA ribosyltransferase-isomerase